MAAQSPLCGETEVVAGSFTENAPTATQKRDRFQEAVEKAQSLYSKTDWQNLSQQRRVSLIYEHLHRIDVLYFAQQKMTADQPPRRSVNTERPDMTGTAGASRLHP